MKDLIKKGKISKMKKISIVLVAIILFFNTTNVYATEVQVRTKVNIKVTVPDDFTDSIRVGLTNSDTGEQFYRELLKSENYEGSLSVLGGVKYNITVIFNNQQNYSILGIEESCFINGTAFALRFNIVKNGTEEKNTYINIETDTHGEEETSKQSIDNVINDTISNTNTEATELFNNAIREMQYYYDNRELNPYIQQKFEGKFALYYDEELVNELCEFLETKNIENINPIDTFIYYFFYDELISAERYLPNREKFLSNFEIYKNHFEADTDKYGTREITDSTYQAILEVWEWIYDYYTKTGTIYNLYENDQIPYVRELKERLSMEKSSDIQKETTIGEEKTITLGEEETTTLGEEKNSNSNSAWDRTIDSLKSNMVTIAILLIIGIILLVLFIKNKRKKENDID